MNKEELQALGLAAAKSIKTEQDLNEFRKILTKISVEAALNAELDDHLGYSRKLWTSQTYLAWSNQTLSFENTVSGLSLFSSKGSFFIHNPGLFRILDTIIPLMTF